MAGLFDKYEGKGAPLFLEQSGVNTKGERFIDAPLPFHDESIPKKFHQRGKKRKLMSITATSPDFKKLMNKLGKKSKGRPSSKPIDFVVYNDASRKATKKESAQGIEAIHYAKFVEYGFTDRAGVWHEGQRLYAKTRNQFKRILIEEYKSMPGRYTRDDIYKAFENAVQRYIDVLVEVTPVYTGEMKGSWNYFGNG